MKRSKRNKHPLIFSLISYTASVLLLLSFFSFIILNLKSPGEITFFLSLTVFPLVALTSTFAVTRYKGEIAIKESLISAIIIASAVIILSIFLKDGDGGLGALLNGAVLIISSALFSYLLKPRYKRRRR